MSDGKDLKNISNQIVDMLVGSTLKKYGVKLGEKELNPEEKEQVKTLVNQLRESVEALSQPKKTEKNDEEGKSDKDKNKNDKK